jgi:hypothetical protein
VTPLSASAAGSARVVSSLVEARRGDCAVRSVGRTDRRDVLPDLGRYPHDSPRSWLHGRHQTRPRGQR